MTIQLPTHGTLSCDSCGETIELELMEFVGIPPTVGRDEDDLPEGWVECEGEHFCPTCVNDGDNHL